MLKIIGKNSEFENTSKEKEKVKEKEQVKVKEKEQENKKQNPNKSRMRPQRNSEVADPEQTNTGHRRAFLPKEAQIKPTEKHS